MNPPAVVGNDVVDLLDPRTMGKATDARFLARVLCEAERTAVAEAADPDETLWRHWAGKEAAYKVVSKLRGEPPVFVHRHFVLSGDAMVHEGTRYPVHVVRDGTVVHALCCAGGQLAEVHHGLGRLDDPDALWNRPLDELMARFTEQEADPIHSLGSAAVRLAARAMLADTLSVEESRLQIVCAPGVTGRRPPRVLLDGAPAAVDVSLSHHGDWIAWAALPPRHA